MLCSLRCCFFHVQLNVWKILLTRYMKHARMFNGVSCDWLVFISIRETDCPPFNCASACSIAIFKIAFFLILSTQHSISCQLSNSSFALLKSINYKWNAIRMQLRTLPIKVLSIQNQTPSVRM